MVKALYFLRFTVLKTTSNGYSSRTPFVSKNYKEEAKLKRIGFVYDRLLDKTFIKETIEKAAKHKSKRRMVKKVMANLDHYVDLIHEMIVNDKIVLRPTHTKQIQERGKIRTITISPFFPNQIFDYLLVELTKPLIKKSMYQYCIGNVDKRGIMYGKKVVEKNVRKYKYFIKLDIRHFYQNVDPKKLLQMFERKIKDKRFINFIRQVIDKKELPIGCYYSQWFSNYFLQGFDHYVKERLQAPFYTRYVDDMVFGANNKKKLTYIYYNAKRYIFNLMLEFKYRPIARDFVNFLGFVFTKTITKLRHSIFYRLQRTMKKVRIHLCYSLAQRLISFFSWLKNIEIGYAYYRNNIKPVIKIGKLKRIMSKGEICYG